MKPVKLSSQRFKLRPYIEPVLEEKSGELTLNFKQRIKELFYIRHRAALADFSNKLRAPFLIDRQTLPYTCRRSIKELNVLRT